MKKCLFPLVATVALMAMAIGCSSNSSPAPTEGPKDVILPQKVELDFPSRTINRGETYKLNATIVPADATNQNVIWRSSDESVATVSGGVVSVPSTAPSNGKAIISATAEAGGQPDFCTVTVIVGVSGFELSEDELTLDEGGVSVPLTALFTPDDPTYSDVIWNTDVDDIVELIIDGGVVGEATAKRTIYVKPLTQGEVDIEVKTAVGNWSAKCHVVVTGDPIAVDTVTVTPSNMLLAINESRRLTAVVLPANAADKTTAWTSSNQAVATVTNGLVTAVSPGFTTIVATSGTESGTCEVEVRKDIYAEEIILNMSTLSMLSKETLVLDVTLLPSNATNRGQVTWQSSNQLVATVHPQTGLITALAPGWTNITAKTEDNSEIGFPSVSATCRVTVQNLYVAGYQIDDDGKTSAQVWTNNVADIPLVGDGGANAKANSIFARGEDVYVAGFSENSQNKSVAIVWKNGVIFERLSDETRNGVANDIFVDEANHVYVAGYEENSRDPKIAVATLWQDAIPSRLSNGGGKAEALSVFVTEHFAYAAGYDTNNQDVTVATFRDYGMFQLIESDGRRSAVANSIFAYGNDFYMAGWEEDDNGDITAKLWKNGNDGESTTLCKGMANWVYVATNGDVYVAGYETTSNGKRASVWKNGSQLVLGKDESSAHCVSVSGSDVYVVGYENSADGKPEAKLWKNGYATILGANAVAKSVMIQ